MGSLPLRGSFADSNLQLTIKRNVYVQCQHEHVKRFQNHH
jgi:hypothetical protein